LKKFTRTSIAKMGKRCVSLLTILTLLTSNSGYIPKAYASSVGNISNKLPISGHSEKNINGTPDNSSTDQPSGIGASTQNDVAENIYVDSSLPAPSFDQKDSLTELVYSENPDVIDKVIDYPAIPSSFLSTGNKVYQGNVHMRHVIHMPRVIEKPVPFTPGINATINEESPANDQNNDTSVAGSVYESLYASSDASAAAPNASVITDLKEGVGENGLNLIDYQEESEFVTDSS
jgi:hypothetical protein